MSWHAVAYGAAQKLVRLRDVCHTAVKRKLLVNGVRTSRDIVAAFVGVEQRHVLDRAMYGAGPYDGTQKEVKEQPKS